MLLLYFRASALLLPLLCVVVGGALAQAPPSPTEPAPPAPSPAAQSLTVMVVDYQALLQNSKAAKMVRSQIEQKRGEYTKEISHQEEGLRAERDALQRQQASLSPEALNQKGRDFQQKVNELEKNVQGKRQALEKSNVLDALTSIEVANLIGIAVIIAFASRGAISRFGTGIFTAAAARSTCACAPRTVTSRQSTRVATRVTEAKSYQQD
jgi:Skp family chaperone for outer membrane proteins